jgi:hypothetical protein
MPIKFWLLILCFADRASCYIHIIQTNTMHYLSSIYFVNHHFVFRHVIAHHQEISLYIYIYIYIYIYNNRYLLFVLVQSITYSNCIYTAKPPDDGQ